MAKLCSFLLAFACCFLFTPEPAAAEIEELRASRGYTDSECPSYLRLVQEAEEIDASLADLLDAIYFHSIVMNAYGPFDMTVTIDGRESTIRQTLRLVAIRNGGTRRYFIFSHSHSGFSDTNFIVSAGSRDDFCLLVARPDGLSE